MFKNKLSYRTCRVNHVNVELALATVHSGDPSTGNIKNNRVLLVCYSDAQLVSNSKYDLEN